MSSLIADLLDRHERRPDATRLLAPVDNDGFSSVDQRDAFDDDLASLEREGGVELVRTGNRSERVIACVRLRDPAVLYRRAGRSPSGRVVDAALLELRARADLSEAAQELINEAARAWSRGVSHLGIAANDVRTLGNVIQLAAAVHARMAQPRTDDVDYRTFSRLAVADSKALERNARQVAAAVSRLQSVEGRTTPDPDELLAGAGIVRLPQPLLIRGSLQLNGREFPRMPFIGVPAECAELLFLRAKPSYLLIIENYTSFVRHVRDVSQNDAGLVIYSGGFPSRPTLKAIARLAADASAPTFHWGDMDAGGVRIFRHIERHVAPLGVVLRPHLMNTDLLRRAGVVTNASPDVIEDMAGSAVAELARLISETGLTHEQEEFSPRSPLEATPATSRIGNAGADPRT